MYPSDMSIVRLLILGVLKRRGSAHGYRIHRDLADWRVETWTVIRPGSIYHALMQMEKLGLASQVTASNQKLGPSKIEYTLTEIGEREFIALLITTLKDINLIELSVGIAFMEFLPRQETLKLLEKRMVAQRQVANSLQTLPTEDIPGTPAKHPELIRIWSDSYSDAAASTEKLIKAIQSGKYVFKNEEVENEKRNSDTP